MNYLFAVLLMLFSVNSTDVTKTLDTATKEVTEVVLESNDQMKFNLSEIKVEAGTTVKLTLKHVGKLPKQVMGHNFVLLKKGVEMKDFAMTAMKAKDNDYIPESTDQIIANTALIGGGESTTIEFEAPEKGEYIFICSFPGHYALMNGKFIVE
mgnify:CR=1|tara:strand:- start:2404 stop:2862 length:459 start_codon:yes stop_codon:yes gene_type:complete